MSNLGKLMVVVGANTSEFNRGMDGVTGKLSSVAAGAAAFGRKMTTFVTLPILAIGGAMLKAAMELEATEAKYNTVFEGMTHVSDAFIKKFQELTPATTAQARMIAAGFQDMLIPMKFARDEATEMTGAFMHVTGALAGFNNARYTTEEVAAKISSALTGMYRPLKDLGVDIDKAAVQAKMLEMGFVGLSGEAERQAEAQATLALIYENSTDALNAYTKENMDAKTEMAIARAEIIDLAAEIGMNLLPIIRDVTKYIRDLTERFADLTVEQQETIIKVGLFVAAIGPASYLVSAIATTTKLIYGLVTAFGAVSVATSVTATSNLVGYASGMAAVGGAAKTAAGAGGLGLFIVKMGAVVAAGVVMLGTLALIATAIGLIILMIKNWRVAWDNVPGEMKNWSPTGAGSGKGASFSGGGSTTRSGLPVHRTSNVDPKSSTGYTTGNTVNTSTSDKKLSWAGLFDTGGIVPGPIGSPQLAIVHGGETILPTHKGGGGMGNTIRHEIDLINVPPTVNKESLESSLMQMLNNPQVKRRIDRLQYENTVATRGLGI